MKPSARHRVAGDYKKAIYIQDFILQQIFPFRMKAADMCIPTEKTEAFVKIKVQ
jgi:hypothetical protein